MADKTAQMLNELMEAAFDFAPAAPDLPAVPAWRRQLGRPALALAAGFAMVLLLVGGGLLLVWTSGGTADFVGPESMVTSTATTLPSTTEVPATAVVDATTTVATTIAVPVTPVGLEMTWEQVPTQSAFGLDDAVWSVIEGGPGLVAVGGAFNNRDLDAAVWTSTDGVAWDRIADPDVFGGAPTDGNGTDGYQMIRDIAAGPAGLVAVGVVDDRFGDLDPPIWVSPDGLSWSRVTGNADALDPGSTINAVATGGPGYVAAGSNNAGSAAIWVSGDGVSWARVEQPPGDGYSRSEITDILTTDSGLVAVGFADPEWQHFPTGRALAWTSQDGLVWDRVELGAEPGTVWAAAGTGEAVIAVGSTSDDSAAWISSDAKTWSPPSPIVTLAKQLWFWDAVWDGGRLLAVGVWFPEHPAGEYPFPGQSGPVAWASDDTGATWHEIPISKTSDEGPFASTVDQRPAGFRDVIAFGDEFLAVGGTGNGSAPIWIGTWNEK